MAHIFLNSIDQLLMLKKPACEECSYLFLINLYQSLGKFSRRQIDDLLSVVFVQERRLLYFAQYCFLRRTFT